MKIAKLTACAVLIFSFFLPWVNVSGINVSGAKLPQIADFFLKLSENDFSVVFTLYINYLIPIIALVYMIYTALNKTARMWGVLSGFIPLGDLIYMLRKCGMTLMHSADYGFYLVFLSSLMLIIVVVFIEEVNP